MQVCMVGMHVCWLKVVISIRVMYMFVSLWFLRLHV